MYDFKRVSKPAIPHVFFFQMCLDVLYRLVEPIIPVGAYLSLLSSENALLMGWDETVGRVMEKRICFSWASKVAMWGSEPVGGPMPGLGVVGSWCRSLSKLRLKLPIWLSRVK